MKPEERLTKTFTAEEWRLIAASLMKIAQRKSLVLQPPSVYERMREMAHEITKETGA